MDFESGLQGCSAGEDGELTLETLDSGAGINTRDFVIYYT
jgi:hypothetical protein